MADDIAAQEEAMRKAMANAKPRALRRKLMRSLDRISKQEEVYHQVLEKKSMDKTSSMYMNSPMSPIRTHHMRPSTTNAMTRSSAWRDVDKEAELFSVGTEVFESSK